MLSSYVVASLVLAGLSTARPHHSFTVSTLLNATTLTSTGTSLIIPTGKTASFDAQTTSPAQLSKRQGDWGEQVSMIICAALNNCKHEVTLTAPGTLVTVTVTSESETGTATAPGTTVTATVPGTTVTAPGTTFTAPGTTVTATVQGTTVTAPGTTVTADRTPITYTVTFTSEPGHATETVTTTWVAPPGPTTVTSEPGRPTETVTTTVVAVPGPTETETVHPPQGTGCWYVREDGSIGTGHCGDRLKQI